jgi:carbon monoxide dehydrogenase subunit G
MDFSGEYRVPAPRERVWQALNDVAILKVCIDGCETLDWTGPNQLRAVVRAKAGPVNARFGGDLTLSDLDPPRSYVLSGKGTGGVAGFAQGAARVTLKEDGPEATRLVYAAQAQVGGKLANLGQRLVLGVASRTAEQFFERFTRRLTVALRAEDLGLGAVDEADEVFEVGPVVMPPDLLAGGAAARGIPLTSARAVVIAGGLGLFLIVLALLGLAG